DAPDRLWLAQSTPSWNQDRVERVGRLGARFGLENHPRFGDKTPLLQADDNGSVAGQCFTFATWKSGDAERLERTRQIERRHPIEGHNGNGARGQTRWETCHDIHRWFLRVPGRMDAARQNEEP